MRSSSTDRGPSAAVTHRPPVPGTTGRGTWLRLAVLVLLAVAVVVAPDVERTGAVFTSRTTVTTTVVGPVATPSPGGSPSADPSPSAGPSPSADPASSLRGRTGADAGEYPADAAG